MSKVDDIGEGGKAKTGAKLRGGGAHTRVEPLLKVLGHLHTAFQGHITFTMCNTLDLVSKAFVPTFCLRTEKSPVCPGMIRKQGQAQVHGTRVVQMVMSPALVPSLEFPLGHHAGLPALLHEVGRTRAASTVDGPWKAATALFGKAVPQRGAERARIRADGYKTDDHREGSDLAQRSPW